MKRFLFSGLMTLWAFTLISWSPLARRTIALIAERHLQPNAKYTLKEVLGDQTLADFAAQNNLSGDKNINLRIAQIYHLTIPPRLNLYQLYDYLNKKNFFDFKWDSSPFVKISYQTDDVFNQRKKESIASILKIVSDFHQPMLISQLGEKRSNSTIVNFEGSKTTLFNVWDSLLIAKQGLSAEQLADYLDIASDATLTQWQTGRQTKWLFESYDVGTMIYSDLDGRRKLDKNYYEQHIAIVNERIYMAGIRLAQVLNILLPGNIITEVVMPPVNECLQLPAIALNSALQLKENVGEEVSVEGKAYRCRLLGSAAVLIIKDSHSKQSIKVVLKGEAMKHARKLYGKNVIFTGRVSLYKKKPLVEVVDEDAITKS